MTGKPSNYLNDGTKAYGRKWQRLRKLFLQANPLCIECSKHGYRQEARVVDHIVDHKGNVDLFWDQGNWQPLCKMHHDKKTGRGARRGKQSVSTGCLASGLPTDAKHPWRVGSN